MPSAKLPGNAGDRPQGGLGQPQQQHRDGHHQPGQRTGDGQVEEGAFIPGDGFHLDERAHGPDRRKREGDEIRQRDGRAARPADKIMAELVRQQDGQQADGKRPAHPQVGDQCPDLARRILGDRTGITGRCSGKQDAQDGQGKKQQVDPDFARLGVDDAAHQQDGLAAFFQAEERGDIVGTQGFGQLVVGLDRVAQQFAAVAQEIALVRVTHGDIIVAEDTADNVVQDLRIG